MDMKRLALLFVTLAASSLMPVTGLCNDPSDQFLKAFMQFQDGERLERSENSPEALQKYQEARELLQQIVKASPDWQPLVVEYRLKKIRESIDRLEATARPSAPRASFGGLEGDMPMADPILPQVPSIIPEYSQSRSTAALDRSASSGVRRAQESEIQALRRQVKELQRSNFELEDRLLQKSAQIQSALVEVDKTKVTVVELRSQLKQTAAALDDVTGEREVLAAERAQWARRLQEIENRMAETDADREVLSEENERLLVKLKQASEYIAASDSIRDGLLTERQSLAGAAEEARQALETKEAEILAAAAAKQETAALAEKEQDAVDAKQDQQDDKALLAENELLKGIIFRQIDEQVKRDEALAGLQDELASRNISSDVISRQVEVLGAPVLQLQGDERSLFEKPMALLSEPDADSLDVTMAISKPAPSEKKQNASNSSGERGQSRPN